MYDFIGDIHGHADELDSLLLKLGYNKVNGVYSHSSRKAFFLGDFIDRGPKIRETLITVRNMVDSGNAVAIMGNHEYNAICFHLQETAGGHVRKHSIKNILQHVETLKQFQNRQEEYEDYLDWFKTLPLFYETEKFRAVHASWDHNNIAVLKKYSANGILTDNLFYESVKSESELHNAVEEILKGKEVEMPDGMSFTDKDGNNRTEIRIKWWEDPSKTTLRNYSVIELHSLPDIIEPKFASNSYYSENDKPVFFGHYWLKGNPLLSKENACCLDYSVAKKGNLVAYRFDGEQKLNPDKLVWVPCNE